MPKLDKDTYRDQRSGSERKPKLTAEMVPTPNVLLTVETAKQVPASERVERAFLALTFREFPDHEWTTNKEQSDLLVRAVEAGFLPEDTDEWGGSVIPMHKVENVNPKTGDKVRKLYPFAPEDWTDALDQARAAQAAKGKGRAAR